MASSIWDAYIADAARRYNVPPALVQGVIKAESNWNPNAVSPAGAKGLMQLMPNTFAGLGLGRDIFDPQTNINGGVKYMGQMRDQFGNWTDAMGAYNAGPGAYMRVRTGQGRLPAETEAYLATLQPTINKLPFPPPGRKPPVETVDIPSLSQPPAQQGGMPAPAAPSGLLGKPTRTDQILDEMDRVLGTARPGPTPDRLQYALEGAIQGVTPLTGPQERRVSPWQVLAAAGSGMAGGDAAYRKAVRTDRDEQVQDLGGRLKVEEMRAAEEARRQQLASSEAFAEQLDSLGHRDLAAAVRRNPALMDEVLKAMAAGRFGRTSTGDYTLGPGMKRFDAGNRVVAEVPANPPNPPAPRTVTTDRGVFAQNPDGSLGPRLGASETAPDVEAPTLAPEQQKELAIETGLPLPAPAPWSNPSLSPRGRSNLVATTQKQVEKKLGEVDEAAGAAAGLVADMDRFTFLNQTNDTGGLYGSPATQATRAAFDAEFGEMVAITAKITPTLRQPGSGATSDFDAKMFQRGTVNVGNPRETNVAIANGAKKAARNLIDRAAFLRTYADTYQHLNGAEAAWKRYLEANPIFDPNAPPGSYAPNPTRQEWREYFRTELGVAKPPAPPPPGGYKAPLSEVEDPNTANQPTTVLEFDEQGNPIQ